MAELGRRCEDVSEAAGLLAAGLQQDDVQAEFLYGPLRLRLEKVLRRVAEERARGDGWTYLSIAGQRLEAEEQGLLKQLTKAFRHGGLKEAVAAMDMFDLEEEPTGSGVRVLYRFYPPERKCPTTS